MSWLWSAAHRAASAGRVRPYAFVRVDGTGGPDQSKRRAVTIALAFCSARAAVVTARRRRRRFAMRRRTDDQYIDEDNFEIPDGGHVKVPLYLSDAVRFEDDGPHFMRMADERFSLADQRFGLADQ